MNKTAERKYFEDKGECLHLEDTFAYCDIWAPEVMKYKDKFYMFYSGRSECDGLMHVQIAVSDSPLGPFTVIFCPSNLTSIPSGTVIGLFPILDILYSPF